MLAIHADDWLEEFSIPFWKLDNHNNQLMRVLFRLNQYHHLYMLIIANKEFY